MYMLKSVISVALFAVYAIAQSTLQFTGFPTGGLQAGQSVTLTWTGGDSTQPVTLTLREGDPNNLNTVSTITTSATGGSYTWTVPTDITNGGAYAIEIQQSGSQPNYTPQFAISGGTGTASASGSASASAAASTMSTSASSMSASTSASTSASASGSSSASASASSSASKSSTSSASTSKASASASSTSAPSSGANGLQSPIALILGAVAAMFMMA